MSNRNKLPQGVVIFAREEAVAGLGENAGQFDIIPVELDDPLPEEALRAAEIAVVEADPTVPASLSRIDAVTTHTPDLPVVVGLAQVDFSTTRHLLHHGITDAVGLPLAMEELLPVLIEVAAQKRAAARGDVELAPLLSVLKSTGGTGGTTVATHMAAALAELQGPDSRSCVIDLDLQNGDAALYLGCQPRMTLLDLLEAEDRLDDELFQTVACEGVHHVDVITAPKEIVPVEDVDFDQLMRVIEVARARYDFVLLDLPAALTNWALSTILTSDLTLLVGKLTIPSLRQARRRLDFLVSMGMDKRTIAVVLNRVEKGLFKTLDQSDASEALHHPILGTLGEDDKLIRTAQDQGVLATDIQPKNKFSKNVAQLAELVAARLEGVA